jgi:hypothetical protein
LLAFVSIQSGWKWRSLMLRIAMYVGGMAAGVAAWMVYREVRAHRKVPVQQAAERLKAAWADYHTRA